MAADSTWTTTNKDSVWARHWLTGLASGTSYEWQIRGGCKSGPTITWSNWSSLQSFTTATQKMANAQALSYDLSELITAYPNPAREQLNINFGGLEGPFMVELYNVAGALVLRQQVLNQERAVLSLEALRAGMYVLSIVHEDVRFHERIVVE